MSLRISATEYFSGLVIGETGLGVLAENIPATGDSGASFLYNDVLLPADNGKEIRGEILTLPSAGTLVAYEDGSFDFYGAPDGTYTFTYRLFVDGVSSGDYTVTLASGVVDGIGTGTPSVVSMSAPVAIGVGTVVGTNGLGTGAPSFFSLTVASATAAGDGGPDGLGAGAPASITIVPAFAVGVGTTGVVHGAGSGASPFMHMSPPSAIAYTTVATGIGALDLRSQCAVGITLFSPLN